MRRFSTSLFFILSFSTLLSAQGQRLSPVITASTAGEKVVRFGSPAPGLAQIRVQIFAATGDPLFDSAWKDGNVFDWQIEPLATGSYRCVVMVKDLEGQVTQKEVVLIAEGDQLSVEPRTGESSPKITMLAHDENNGAIVNTSGDLSFRFGEFFAGKDGERMRLTAEGNLGIGTDKPQAPLDVNGLIRTSKGIMFPDGTILTTAGGGAATAQSREVTRQIPIVVGGLAPDSQTSANSRRLTPRPNAPGYQFVVDSAGVHIGTTSAFGLDVAGNVNLSSNLALPATTATVGVITLGGERFAHAFGAANAFLGVNAGNLTMTGTNNAAMGSEAFASNTTGDLNTAIGSSALRYNTIGCCNTASGMAALQANTTGRYNTGIGEAALQFNTDGENNTASGASALDSNISGYGNTANGTGALRLNTTGSYNIGLGESAGENLTTGDYNIDIGHGGVAEEAHTIRIGTNLDHTRVFLAGVRGVTTGNANGLTVLIDSAGQLGTVSSSASVKRDIAAISESSELMKLRPVSFFYRSDAVGIRQYGLIAEEVAEVMPQLVQFSPAGEAETVRYHFLPPLLLDQVQKQHRQIEEQQKTIDALMARLEALERQTVRSQ